MNNGTWIAFAVACLVVGYLTGDMTHKTTKQDVEAYLYAEIVVGSPASCTPVEVDQTVSICSGGSWISPVDVEKYNKSRTEEMAKKLGKQLPNK